MTLNKQFSFHLYKLVLREPDQRTASPRDVEGWIVSRWDLPIADGLNTLSQAEVPACYIVQGRLTRRTYLRQRINSRFSMLAADGQFKKKIFQGGVRMSMVLRTGTRWVLGIKMANKASPHQGTTLPLLVCGAGPATWGLMHTKLAAYHWTTSPVPAGSWGQQWLTKCF